MFRNFHMEKRAAKRKEKKRKERIQEFTRYPCPFLALISPLD